MPRYIDAEKLIELATHEGAYGYVDVHDILKTPIANVVEVRHGEWIKKVLNRGDRGLKETVYECSLCGVEVDFPYHGCPWNYCPCCGADMGEEGTDESV